MHKRMLFLTFVLLSLSLPTYSMHSFAQRNIPRFFTGAHWLIAAGPLWIIGAATTKISSDAQLSEEVYRTKPFNELGEDFLSVCHAAIEKTTKSGTPAPVLLSIDWTDAQALTALNAVCLHRSYMNRYYKYLWEEDFHELKRVKNEIKFLLGHEARHLENHDTQAICIMAGALPLFTEGFSRLVSAQFKHKQPGDQKITQTLLKNAMRIPTGFAKLFVSYALFSYFMAYREYRADIEAAELLGSNPARYGAEMFKRANISDQNAIDSRVTTKKLPGWMDKEKISDVWLKLDQSNITYPLFGKHPSHISRAQYLEKLAQKIENERETRL